MAASLVPELLCSDLAATRAFYVDVLGFRLAYERVEDTFIYLTRDGSELMFEQVDGPGRRWITGPLERPFGRGINLQLQVDDVVALFARVRLLSSESIYSTLEEKAYRCSATTCVVRQFFVQDPDGYLLRFAQDAAAEESIGNVGTR